MRWWTTQKTNCSFERDDFSSIGPNGALCSVPLEVAVAVPRLQSALVLALLELSESGATVVLGATAALLVTEVLASVGREEA